MEAIRRPVRSYRDLIAWQRAFQLANACYDLADSMPDFRLHSTADQLRRAGLSVGANIAEGNGRLSRGDYIRHLRIAHGSLMEVDMHLLLIRHRRYGSPALVENAIELRHEVGRLLGALIRSLEQLPPTSGQRKRGSAPPKR